MDIEDPWDGASPQTLSITDTTDIGIGTFFEKDANTTSNAASPYTNEYFQEGHVYELEMSYKRSSPGEDNTIFQSAIGAGASLVSDTTTGTATALIGPITTTFSPTNVSSGTITITFTQTSP